MMNQCQVGSIFLSGAFVFMLRIKHFFLSMQIVILSRAMYLLQILNYHSMIRQRIIS